MNDAGQLAALRMLIIVCCHAVYIGDKGAHVKEEQWLLQPFQRSNPSTGKPGEHETFIAHISAAGAAGRYDRNSLVVFSGGRTTTHHRTEAESYHIAASTVLEGSSPGNAAKTENHATDSYQNLLFSILQFRRYVGHYPESVTMITHAFKERRFLELHARAIKWPPTRIRIQGINPPFTLAELREAEEGERERAYNAFASDLYGARSPLADKKKARNWDPAMIDKLCAGLEPEIRELLLWTGGETGHEVFPGRLPWEDA